LTSYFTVASSNRAGRDPPPSRPPPVGKPAKKKAITGDSDLSMFNILNTFHCHWFLSKKHLRAQALLAQKAEDGKIF
jgi:hypothetical protein